MSIINVSTHLVMELKVVGSVAPCKPPAGQVEVVLKFLVVVVGVHQLQVRRRQDGDSGGSWLVCWLGEEMVV